MMFYAALWAPEFRLQAVLRYAPELKGEPFALVDASGTKPHILEARASEVVPGMTVTQATARCHGLQLMAPNPGQEASAQEVMLQTAQALSPFVEWTASGIVTIELPLERKVAEDDLRRRVVAPLAALGLEIRVGVASNPDLALLAARHAEPIHVVRECRAFLRPLPIEDLAPSPELLEVLYGWGIRTVGNLLDLPMTETCKRLGHDAVALWDRAKGGHSRPLRTEKARDVFEEKTELEFTVETLEPLLFLIRRFLDQLSKRLEQSHLVAARLRLVLTFDDGTDYEKAFAIPSPTRNVDLLFRMLHTHLENFTASAPIVGLAIEITPTRPIAEQFGLLEKGLKDPHQFAETLARLIGLVGEGRVGLPRIEDSHRPDAVFVDPYVDRTSPPLAHPLIGLPLYRFRPPLRAEVRVEEAHPAYIRSERFHGPVAEVLGPWRMQGHWWSPQTWQREEWDIATDAGFYRLARVGREWLLEGIYG